MDIDIDFYDRNSALAVLDHIIATRKDEDRLVPHNTGVYFHNIPHDPITNLSTIDYKTGEERGYFKIDFLNIHAYKGVRDEDHLVELMNTEPIWELLEEERIVNQLFHLSKYGVILRSMKPRTVEQLGAVLGMIRPGKKHLIGKPWNKVMEEIWIDNDHEEYIFRKSHAISYALVIIVQLNLLVELSNSFNQLN